MASSKAEEASANKAVAPEDAPPAYAGPSTNTPAPSPPAPGSTPSGPTAASPFDFPSEAPLPAYSSSAEAGPSSSQSHGQLPIAVPQITPQATAVFLSAYAPDLLGYGITSKSWQAFLDTTSAFLAAKVSDRALSHAADVGKHIGHGPKSLVKGVYSHAKDVGRGIGNNAKRGNIVGAAFGVVGGAISIPVSAALGTVRTALQLPGSTVSAVAKKPQTPRERATAYLAVANRDWFHARGLHASLLDSQELSKLIGASVTALIEAAQNAKKTSVEAQFDVLEGHVAKLEVDGAPILDLGDATLWLVLTTIDKTTT